MGKVNRRTLHCRFAKIHGVMYGGKFSAVIGRESISFVFDQYEYAGYGVFKPSTALYLPPHIKPRISGKRQCKLPWLTPHTSHLELYARSLDS
jgi:hypothetical protein